MADNFNDPFATNLVGLWDFLNADPKADTGLADGIAQNGDTRGDVSFSGGRAHFDGHGDVFDVAGDGEVSGNDAPFDLATGTIAVQFTQDCHVGTSPDTIVNRGEYADRGSEGFFEIRVTKDGRVEVMHCSNGADVLLRTEQHFFDEGDNIKVTYSWDEATGATFKVENLTDNTDTVITTSQTDLTMDIGDNDDESFSFGARETDDGHYSKYFDGAIDYVAVYDIDINNPPEPPLDGIVLNDNNGALIDASYDQDPEGDMIDAGDAVLPGEGPDDDIVDANGGDDKIIAGLGDDDVYAGSGNDSVEGGDGNDLIFGDSNYAGPNAGTSVRESFEWDLAGVGDGHPLTGFTQNTGTVDVTFAINSISHGATTQFADDDQNVSNIVSDGNPVDDNSSLSNILNGEDNSAEYQFDFSTPVEDVSFRVNDIDGDGVVRVTAFDDLGNAVVVNLTGGNRLTLLDTDGVPGNDTADSKGGYQPDTSSDYSILVDIPGPVSRIVIEHDQDDDDNSGINITDIYFDAPLIDDGEDGNDELIGGDGDDTIFGEGGDDVLVGGDGADVLDGGDDADTIFAGAGDVVDGGSGGFNANPTQNTDLDVLDLTGQGPFFLDNVTQDGNGNGFNGTVVFVDTDGNPTGLTIEFTEIEEVIGEEINRDPDAVDDIATVNEDETVIIQVLANDSDPDGDPLEVIDATSPDGDVTINPDGTITFTPTPNFNGDTTITYTISDGNGGFDTATVDVTVNPVNDDPVANDDVADTPFNTPVVISPIDNDSDVDGDALEIDSFTQPANGTVIDNGDGTLTYTPDPGFEGPDTFEYTVSDGNGGTDTAQVTVTVEEQPLDGIVEGTDDGELIDVNYTGDPEGDRVDSGDNIFSNDPDDANDDIIVAGGGDDTVIGGAGSDTIDGGDGDDLIRTDSGVFLPDRGFPNDAGTPVSGFPFGFPADPDPDNNRSLVLGGNGNDTIFTGDDADTINGGAGNDAIDGGIDDDELTGDAGADRIVGGEGSDLIDGGTGNDTIFAGNDPILGLDQLNIEDDGSNPVFPADPRPDNGRDTVFGGEGDDLIFGADDDDELYGDEGNDTIDGEIDDDFIDGGVGDDSLLGGQGNDTIEGGDGDDFIDGGLQKDTLLGGDGNDTILGGNGADSIDGGAGDDLIDGGTGDDNILRGGTGNDTIIGSTGADQIDGGDGDDLIDLGRNVDGNVAAGGADRDTFINVSQDDTVDGGGDGDDFDVLDLRGSADRDGSLQVTFTNPDTNGNGFDGFVTYFDQNGNATGTLQFTDIEKVIPCFTPGTLIATPTGERRVEDLKVGDRVITRDNGIQEIRWVGAREMSGDEFERAPHLKPVLIRQGALGRGLPERDMLVSPQHRVLMASDKTALYFDESEVLVAAKHLTGMDGIDSVDVSGTIYIHIMFDQHEVILSDGAWTESFQPGDVTLGAMGEAQRAEIIELFPELATAEGREAYASARRSLKKHEARLLV